jgi:hypothetical protein
MSHSEYTANLALLADANSAYRNNPLNGEEAKKALANFYRAHPEKMPKKVTVLTKLITWLSK